MTLDEYQAQVKRTANDDPSWLPIAALGLAGEVGEVIELIKKHLGHGHELDREKMCLELGDVLFYVTDLATRFGLTLNHVALENDRKLRARYPNGFTSAASLDRTDQP